MKLKEFIQETGISVKSIAQKCGLHKHTLYNILGRRVLPGAKTIASLEKFTGGKVRAIDYLEDEDREEVEKVKSVFDI